MRVRRLQWGARVLTQPSVGGSRSRGFTLTLPRTTCTERVPQIKNESQTPPDYCKTQLINISETQRSLDENCSGGVDCHVSLISYYLIRASLEPRGLHE